MQNFSNLFLYIVSQKTELHWFDEGVWFVLMNTQAAIRSLKEEKNVFNFFGAFSDKSVSFLVIIWYFMFWYSFALAGQSLYFFIFANSVLINDFCHHLGDPTKMSCTHKYLSLNHTKNVRQNSLSGWWGMSLWTICNRIATNIQQYFSKAGLQRGDKHWSMTPLKT